MQVQIGCLLDVLSQVENNGGVNWIFRKVFWKSVVNETFWPPVLSLTSAKCANKAILWTVFPSPISSAKIPLIPCGNEEQKRKGKKN